MQINSQFRKIDAESPIIIFLGDNLKKIKAYSYVSILHIFEMHSKIRCSILTTDIRKQPPTSESL